MKNKELWEAKRFQLLADSKIDGTYNHKIIGYAYHKVIRKYASGKLVDVGCGDVPFYHFYKDLVTENVCIDWGNSSLGTSYLDHEADLNEGLPFLESASFDTVLCTDVLEHIHNPELLFSEMSRILKKEGKMILTVPFLYWIHDNPHDYHRYTHFKLQQFCDKNALKVELLEAYGGLPEIIFDLVHKGIGFYNIPASKFFLYMWRGLGNFLSRRKFVQRLSESSKSNFPMGYVLVATKK